MVSLTKVASEQVDARPSYEGSAKASADSRRVPQSTQYKNVMILNRGRRYADNAWSDLLAQADRDDPIAPAVDEEAGVPPLRPDPTVRYTQGRFPLPRRSARPQTAEDLLIDDAQRMPATVDLLYETQSKLPNPRVIRNPAEDDTLFTEARPLPVERPGQFPDVHGLHGNAAAGQGLVFGGDGGRVVRDPVNGRATGFARDPQMPRGRYSTIKSRKVIFAESDPRMVFGPSGDLVLGGPFKGKGKKGSGVHHSPRPLRGRGGRFEDSQDGGADRPGSLEFYPSSPDFYSGGAGAAARRSGGGPPFSSRPRSSQAQKSPQLSPHSSHQRLGGGGPSQRTPVDSPPVPQLGDPKTWSEQTRHNVVRQNVASLDQTVWEQRYRNYQFDELRAKLAEQQAQEEVRKRREMQEFEREVKRLRREELARQRDLDKEARSKHEAMLAGERLSAEEKQKVELEKQKEAAIAEQKQAMEEAMEADKKAQVGVRSRCSAGYEPVLKKKSCFYSIGTKWVIRCTTLKNDFSPTLFIFVCFLIV